MSGTAAGARKAVAKILAREPGFFARVGRVGGQNSTTGGFYGNPELARVAGTLGGTVSRRRAKGESIAEHRDRINEIRLELGL